jgi:aspartyl-tRNA(Asn)/glutamyl-tRNA(Gln) amidotransferase subunit C
MDSIKLQNIAFLARLRFEGKELEELTDDFNKIMSYVDKVQELDTSSITEMDLYPHLQENAIRKDEIGTSLGRDELSKISPKFENGYIVVPRVIET